MANETKIVITAATDQAERSMRTLGDSVNGAAKQMLSLSSVAGTLGGALSISALVSMTNEFTNLQNRMKLVTSSTAELTQVTGKLFEVAQSTRQSFGDTVDMYTRIARSSKELGLSQDQLLNITKTVNNAILISGASTAEAASGVVQFGQAMASGKLQGDELRSILENMPRLAEAIAKGMGVTTGELRVMGAAGTLTSKTVADAVMNQSSVINAEAESMSVTLSQASIQMSNSLMMYVGSADQATNSTGQLAKAISDIAKDDTFGTFITGAALGTSDFVRALVGGVKTAIFTFHEFGITLNTVGLQLNALVTFKWGEIGQIGRDGIARMAQVRDEYVKSIEDLNKNSFVFGNPQLPDQPAAKPAAQNSSNSQVKLDSFIGDKGNLSAAAIKQKEHNDLLAKFTDAVKGYSKDSAEYLSAYAALQQGIKNIDEKGAKKPAKEKADPNISLVANLQAEQFRKEAELAGNTAAQIKLLEMARGGATAKQLSAANAAQIQIDILDKELKARKDLQKQIEDAAKGGAIVNGIAQDYGIDINKKNRTLNDAMMSSADKQHADNLDSVAVRAARAREELAKLAITDEARITLLNSVNQAETEQKQKLEELRLQVDKNNSSWEYGAKVAMRNYLDGISNVAKQSESLFTKAFKGMEDALVNFVKTGKLDFASLADSIISDLMRMQIQKSIMQPIAGAFDAAGGLGGIFSGLFGSGTSASPSSTSATASTWTSTSMPMLPSFAVGTDYVPHDMIAQIHKGERIVPAAFNPANGGGGQAITISQPISIDARGADAGVEQRLRTMMPMLLAENSRSIVGAVNQALVSRGQQPIRV